jgi:hypothetical protein
MVVVVVVDDVMSESSVDASIGRFSTKMKRHFGCLLINGSIGCFI